MLENLLKWYEDRLFPHKKIIANAPHKSPSIREMQAVTEHAAQSRRLTKSIEQRSIQPRGKLPSIDLEELPEEPSEESI